MVFEYLMARCAGRLGSGRLFESFYLLAVSS
jgi:hypothetical protein